ncbi:MULTISPECIES: HlyD family secretion protein [Burkholderia cepacia complex]|uniref:HlyD family secretion protein n=1 Tax=Burkholderia cepacia complex TaxID=87882 RepID=UPI000AB5D6D7|nr:MULTISPECIES: HlyD family secretion protein [Burkholderia cepacia complex]MCA8452164.1 HlyD family secretion protein [Burkholderia vietnamiensis]MDN7669661.1 HlyD family secretion protein [Burkholderia vietnamiensis]
MNMKPITLAAATALSLALTGCGHSEVDTVKAATVPQDSTHTYDTALSKRRSCEKDEWRSFKDDTNRTVVEYRCDLKDGAALLAALRQQKISDTQHDYQGYYRGLDQTAERIRQKNPDVLEKQLADAQRQLAQLQANGAPSGADMPEGLKQVVVNHESAMQAAQSSVERAQRELDDARNNRTGVQQERARFEKAEKDALAQIDKAYGGVTKATEVFQWFVRDDEVVSAWTGVELAKQDGSTARLDRNWSQAMWDLLHHRGDDHVHAVLNIPDNIVPDQQPPASEAAAVPKAIDAAQPSGKGQDCYDAKLKDFRNGMGEEAPVSNDMMNEWRGQCGLSPA